MQKVKNFLAIQGIIRCHCKDHKITQSNGKKCSFPMAAQISFAQMFSLQLWHFQCSDEISFVSASHPLNLFFSPKHILVFNQVWMPGNLLVFLGKLKNEKHKTQLLKLSHNKTKNNVQPISTYLRNNSFDKTSHIPSKKLMRECVPRCESSWPFFRVWLPHYCSPWPQMVTVTLLQAAGNGANQQLG